RQLGASDQDIETAGSATQYMSNRVGRLFEREREEHSVYGSEMIQRGRAGLAAGVRLSTLGAGTHEDLLKHTYTGRSRAEITQARRDYKSNYGEDLDVMLGLQERQWGTEEYAVTALLGPVAGLALYGSEVSGDLAFELQILSLGEPETDLDHARIAGLRYNQQRNLGTGFIASVTMEGTPQQQTLDNSRNELGAQILAAARSNPAAAGRRLPGSPAEVFGPNGEIRPGIAKLAFSNGRLYGAESGERNRFYDLVHGVRLASDSYRAEIDRQESILTSAITALAIAVSVVLLFVPGVNIVAAGILTALIAGAATVAVKCGMRGGRYGWEEAATDVAMTAVEVATAGIGGAAAGGLGRAGMAGRLAGVGEKLTGRFGRVGASVIREGITNAASSAAQVAMQDETWNDGMGNGMLKVLGGGVRGAAVGAVTAGVSEGLEGRLAKALDPGLTDASKLTRLQRVGQSLGPRSRDMLKEAVSESLGSISGESVGVIADVMSGQHRGGLQGALKKIGQAGLRDMVSGAGRSAALGRNRARYRRLLTEARSRTDMTNSDYRALYHAGISAGVMNYGQGIGHIRSEVDQGRNEISTLPSNIQPFASGLDQNILQQIRSMLETGDFGTLRDRNNFINGIREASPELNAGAFLRELNSANTVIRDEENRAHIEKQQQVKKVRKTIGSGLEGPVVRSLSDLPMDGFDRLPDVQLKRAAAMIAGGRIDKDAVGEILRHAKAEDPDFDGETFLRNLENAVDTVQIARKAEQEIRKKHRQEIIEMVPEDARTIFADLSDKSIGTIKKLLDHESPGSPQQREAFYRDAKRNSPDMTRDRFKAIFESAVQSAKEKHDNQRSARREDRMKRMGHLPEELRRSLSVLPDDALVELRILVAQGKSLSPAVRQQLLDAAVRETPDVDIPVIKDAIDEAVSRGKTELDVSGMEESRLRSELEKFVPRDLRHHLEDVPVLVVRDVDFESFTRSHKGQAVTMIVNGRPVV
ncbi:MAG: hypothetical protein GY850_32610, partial [bacterium]|nr:hypothetical protein [bacterium]